MRGRFGIDYLIEDDWKWKIAAVLRCFLWVCVFLLCIVVVCSSSNFSSKTWRWSLSNLEWWCFGSHTTSSSLPWTEAGRETHLSRNLCTSAYVCWSILWEFRRDEPYPPPPKKNPKGFKNMFFLFNPFKGWYISESEGESVDIFFLRFLRLKLFKGDINLFSIVSLEWCMGYYC